MKPLISALVALFVLIAPRLDAQTSTHRLQWTQADVATVVDAQALVYWLKVDAAPASQTPQTCVAASPGVTCTTPLPVLASGTHTLILTVDNGFGMASATLTGGSPAAPTNVKIVITVTVQ